MAELHCRKKSLTETQSSGSGSSPEEERRLKALFISCDSNNDGRLDKSDLVTMCKKLNMQDMAEDIICALGANVKGSTISFPEFLKCRAQVLQVAESGSQGAEYLHYYSQSQYDQVQDSCSDLSQIYSSVDYDSGTHEVHEEPLSIFAMLHQCYPDLYQQWTARSKNDSATTLSQQLLQCVNHIHLARINRLYSELKVALKRINNANASRDMCQKEISRTQKERDKLKQELQNQSARYEDRLTELHSVIAELQKKKEIKDRNIIPEEDEEGINEVMEDYEKLDHNKLLQRHQSSTCSLERSMILDLKTCKGVNIEVQTEVTVRSDSQVTNIQKGEPEKEKIQEAAETQLRLFHHNNIYLQEKLSSYENVVSNLRNQLGSVVEEREALRRQLRDLQESVDTNGTPHIGYPQFSSSCSVSKGSLDSKSTNSSSSSPARPMMGVRQQSKQIQMKAQPAEPDWVSKVVSRYQIHNQGSSNIGVQGAVTNYLNEDSGFIRTSGFLFLQELADQVPYPSMVEPFRRVCLEWQRLVAVTDRESSDKLLLESTLAESKSIADQLQCALVQLQSDCAALTKCSILSDQIIELADILIQLQETDPLGGLTDIGSQSALLEPAYQNSSVVMGNDNGNGNDISQLRHGYREQLESAAKLFLYRLECYSSMGRQTPDSGAGVSSTLSSGGGSVDVEGALRQASGSADWSKADEVRLRRLLDQLIAERNRSRLSVAGNHLGQSFYGNCLSASNQSSLKRENRENVSISNLDHSLFPGHQQFIESAILLQEVCVLKEERATLKTSIYLLEKEIKSLQLGLDSRIAAEKSLKVQLSHMMQHRSENSLLPTTEDSRKWKNQVNDLLQVLEELRDRCQLQQQQNEEFVNDLKRANAALIAAFDKAKRKYQSKISRLEQQLSVIPLNLVGSPSDETAL